MRLGKRRVRGVGERGLLEANRFHDPFAVQIADELAGHLLQDEPEQHRVGVGVAPLGAGIEQRGLLHADLHQFFAWFSSDGALSASIALLEADCYTVDFASDAKEF